VVCPPPLLGGAQRLVCRALPPSYLSGIKTEADNFIFVCILGYLLLFGSVDVTLRRMRCDGFAYLKLLSRNYLRIIEINLIKSLAGIRAENCRYSNDNAL
jgi:hypothetical protein